MIQKYRIHSNRFRTRFLYKFIKCSTYNIVKILLSILAIFIITACGTGKDSFSPTNNEINTTVTIVAGKTPRLNFSDLITGPDTGLNDGLGSGVIVTIWGQNVGSAQEDSLLTFTDSEGTVHQPAHKYYWKNADGNLPGGPAKLYE